MYLCAIVSMINASRSTLGPQQPRACHAETKCSCSKFDMSISPSCHQSGGLCLARCAGGQAVLGRVSDRGEVPGVEPAEVSFNRHALNRYDFNFEWHDFDDVNRYVGSAGHHDFYGASRYDFNVEQHAFDDVNQYDFNVERHSSDRRCVGNFLSRAGDCDFGKLFWEQGPRWPDALG